MPTKLTGPFGLGIGRYKVLCRKKCIFAAYFANILNILIGGSVRAATPHKHWRFEDASNFRLPHASATSYSLLDTWPLPERT
jgi:hypothetical protein